MYVYLIGLGVLRTLCILGLFDVFYHLPQKRMTVVLVLCHQYFQHEPEAPTHISTSTLNMPNVKAHIITTESVSHSLLQHSLFDVFELFIFMWFREVWVMGQQVDHIRNYILRKEGDKFF